MEAPWPTTGHPIKVDLVSISAGGGGPTAARIEFNTRGGMKGNSCEEIWIHLTDAGLVAQIVEKTMSKWIPIGQGDIWEVDSAPQAGESYPVDSRSVLVSH